MNSEELSQIGDGGFEGLKKVNEFGSEYWSARDLQPLLGYSQWRRFENAIKKAVTSCEQSANEPEHHFASAGKMVGIGSETSRNIPDYHLFSVCLLSNRSERRLSQAPNRQRTEVFRYPDTPPRVVRPGDRRSRTAGTSKANFRRVQSAVRRRASGRRSEPHVRNFPRCRLQGTLRRPWR